MRQGDKLEPDGLIWWYSEELVFTCFELLNIIKGIDLFLLVLDAGKSQTEGCVSGVGPHVASSVAEAYGKAGVGGGCLCTRPLIMNYKNGLSLSMAG